MILVVVWFWGPRMRSSVRVRHLSRWINAVIVSFLVVFVSVDMYVRCYSLPVYRTGTNSPIRCGVCLGLPEPVTICVAVCRVIGGVRGIGIWYRVYRCRRRPRDSDSRDVDQVRHF